MTNTKRSLGGYEGEASNNKEVFRQVKIERRSELWLVRLNSVVPELFLKRWDEK